MVTSHANIYLLDQYHCPVTYKVFNDHSYIVAIKTTGNVFSNEVCMCACVRARACVCTCVYACASHDFDQKFSKSKIPNFVVAGNKFYLHS